MRFSTTTVSIPTACLKITSYLEQPAILQPGHTYCLHPWAAAAHLLASPDDLIHKQQLLRQDWRQAQSLRLDVVVVPDALCGWVDRVSRRDADAHGSSLGLLGADHRQEPCTSKPEFSISVLGITSNAWAKICT